MVVQFQKKYEPRMWANAQRDGRPARKKDRKKEERRTNDRMKI